ncbi:MAG UNVERIFIED_CONTAM: VWA domain-containing protein [Planctomycetaceae bacterium]
MIWSAPAVDETSPASTIPGPGSPAPAPASAGPARPQDAVPPANTIPTVPVVEADTRAFTSTELDLPESTAGILFAVVGLAALFTITIRTSLRDTRFLSRTARTLLLVPRLLVLLLLLVVLLNPRTRTQISRLEKSRIGLVLDTSLSMQWPAAAAGESRSDAAIRKLLVSPVLSELSRSHSISVYTFDSTLTGPWAIVSDGTVRFVSPEASSDAATAPVATVSLNGPASTSTPLPLDSPQLAQRWQQLLQPRGIETRMGESVYQIVGQMAGRTLAGVVVVSDGRSNAGLDVEPARLRAERSGTRLLSVGVGDLRPQLNLRLAGMQSPEDVHQGDPFDLQVSVQGSAAAGQTAVAAPVPADGWQQWL